jgi:hypothetical protein
MDNAENRYPNQMEDTQARGAEFGDDYIPLVDFTQGPTRSSLATNASTQPRSPWITTRVAHLFAKPVERIENSLKEETRHLVLPAASSSEIDVQMGDYNTELSPQNPTILGFARQRLVEQLGSSGDDGEGSTPKLLLTSTPTLDARMETAAPVVDSSTSQVISSPSAHPHIEVPVSNRGSEQACPPIFPATDVSRLESVGGMQAYSMPQPRRLAASDLMQVDKDREIGNPKPPTNFLHSAVEGGPNPKWPKRTGLGQYTENLKDLSFSEFIALDDQGLRERGVDLQNAHNAQGHLASIYDNQHKGITYHTSMRLETG